MPTIKARFLISEDFFPDVALLRSLFVTVIFNMNNFDASKCAYVFVCQVDIEIPENTDYFCQELFVFFTN